MASSMLMMNTTTTFRISNVAFQPKSSQSLFSRNLSFATSPAFPQKIQRTRASSVDPTVDKAYKEAKQNVEDTSKDLDAKAKEGAQWAGDAAKNASTNVTETAQNLGDKAKEGAQWAGDAAKDAAENATKTAQDLGEKAKDAATDAWEKAKDATSQ